MSLTSFYFFIFLFVTLAIYYAVPKMQKYVLLAASLLFYFLASAATAPKMILLTGYIWGTTYVGARIIDRCEGKKRTFATALTISSLVALLIIFKYLYNMSVTFGSIFGIAEGISWLEFVPYIGMSYFLLSAIGYIAEVSWKSYPAEKNIFSVGLFIYYFPQLISGPVARFAEMNSQYQSPKTLEYNNIVNGLRRMAWGYFKKLVISERFAYFPRMIYGDYVNYWGGGDLFVATLCYAVQLYTDFSGCMDIIMGASELFGMKLQDNFRAPFFSKTVQEFWQRWHITLGGWFRDFVMYPLQKSNAMISLGKWSKKSFGKKAGKKIAFHCSMLVLWVLLGIWHGGLDYFFVASGLIPFVLLFMSDILKSVFLKINKILHIKTESFVWVCFQRIRTTLLICVCWIFICALSVGDGVEVFQKILFDISSMNIYPLILSMNTSKLRIIADLGLMGMGLALLFVEHYLIDKGTSIFKFTDKQWAIFRLGFIYVEVMIILVFGMVGQSEFIYFQF